MGANRSHSFRLAGWFLLGVATGVGMSRRIRRGASYSFRDRVVVITGGSRGLGLLMARELAKAGAKIALLARSEADLGRAWAELADHSVDVLTVPCDVRQREQVEESIRLVGERFGRIDVVINNAGIIQVGPLAHVTLQDFEDAMAVHLYGPVYTTMAALPYLRRNGSGRIVNISSIGGKVAVPHLLPYVASKFALSGFSEALQAELRREGILVTTVYPALMRTGSPPNALFKGKHKQEYAWFAVMDSLPLLSMSADRAARKILAAARRGSPRLALGIQTKAAIVLNDLFPNATARLLAIMNNLLPSADPGSGTAAYSGKESQSAVAPSLLTRLSDRAGLRNNETS